MVLGSRFGSRFFFLPRPQRHRARRDKSPGTPAARPGNANPSTRRVQGVPARARRSKDEPRETAPATRSPTPSADGSKGCCRGRQRPGTPGFSPECPESRRRRFQSGGCWVRRPGWPPSRTQVENGSGRIKTVATRAKTAVAAPIADAHHHHGRDLQSRSPGAPNAPRSSDEPPCEYVSEAIYNRPP